MNRGILAWHCSLGRGGEEFPEGPALGTAHPTCGIKSPSRHWKFFKTPGDAGRT